MKKIFFLLFALFFVYSCDSNRRNVNNTSFKIKDTSYEVWAKDSMNGYKVYIKGKDTIIEDYGAKPE